MKINYFPFLSVRNLTTKVRLDNIRKDQYFKIEPTNAFIGKTIIPPPRKKKKKENYFVKKFVVCLFIDRLNLGQSSLFLPRLLFST